MSLKKFQRGVLAVTAITAFLTTFSSSSMELSIPHMEREFGVNAALIGWVLSAYILTTAAMSVPFGKVADVKGRRKVLLLGMGGFAVSSVVCGLAVSFPMLMAGRVLQGIFASMIFATNNAILISVFPRSRRGRVLGISISFTYIGLSAGPVIGGFLNHYVGWRSIFVIAAILGVTALLLGIAHTPKLRVEKARKKPDIAGNILFIGAIVVTLYGLTNLTVIDFGWLILVCGLALGALFVLTEMRADDPVVRISMFTKSRVFTFSNLAALLNYGATYAISYLMSIYLQVVQGFDSQVAGLIMVCMPGVQAVFTPLMGRLSDRVSPHKLSSGGMAVCVLSLIGMSTIGIHTKIPFIMCLLACAGFSFALFSSPNTNAILSSVGKEDYASANAILATMRTAGQSTSMAVVTIIVGIFLGSTALEQARPQDLVSTMRCAFIVFVILCAAGIYLSLKRNKVSGNAGNFEKKS